MCRQQIESKYSWLFCSDIIQYVLGFFFFFGCRLNPIYCCSTLFKWPAFSEGRNSSQFFIAWKAGYNHPPPLDSWRQLIIRRPKTHVWCFYLVREAQLYQAIPRRLFLYKEILSPTGWDLICLQLQMMWELKMGNCIDRALRENLKRGKDLFVFRIWSQNTRNT